MSFRSVWFSIIAVSMLLTVTLRAADDDGKKAKHMKGYVAFVLSHADDLKLTDDEKTKLTALQADDKPPDGADKDKIKEHNKEIHAKVAEILTKDQKDKLKELAPGKKAAAAAPATSTPAPDAPKEEAKKDDAPKDAPKEEAKKDDGNNMGN